MAHSVNAFEVTKTSIWSQHSFYMWMADDSLRGLHNHKSSASGGVSFIPFAFDMVSLGVIGLVIGVVLALLLLPIAIALAIMSSNRQEKADRQLDELDANSDEYLAWDKRNFRLRLADIKRAEFFEPGFHLSTAQPIQNLRLHLHSGEEWHFTLKALHEARQLQALFEQKHIATTQLEGQSLKSYLSEQWSRRAKISSQTP